jgi:hypothetical protein
MVTMLGGLVVFPALRYLKNIHMRLQSEEEGTIKEICFRMFERGFSAYEIIEKKRYNKSTVLYYRSRHRNESIEKWIQEVKDATCMDSYRKEFSREEMDYGHSLPTYKFKYLTRLEKSLTRKREHTQLKQIDYEEGRL